MSRASRNYILATIAVAYLVTSFAAYFTGSFRMQFVLAIPWSMLISTLGMLLVHMGSGYLDIALLVGAIFNLVLFVKLSFFTSDSSEVTLKLN